MRFHQSNNNWPYEKSENYLIKLGLFFVSPLLAFLWSLGSLKTKSSYIIFFLFFLYFGICFTPLDSGLDSYTYIESFKSMQYVTTRDLITLSYNSIYLEGYDKGLYFVFSSYLISLFTNNYHFLFLFFALVFSFFSLRSFKMLSHEKEFDSSVYCLIICFLFSFNQIFNINGVRFWTAAWVAVFCLLKIVLYSDKKFWLLLLLTPFIHQSFWFLIVVVLLILSSRKFEYVWTVLFFLSFIFANLSLTAASERFADILPSSLAHMLDVYTSEDALAKRADSSLVGTVFDGLVHFYRGVIIVYFINKRKKILSDIRTERLFLFLLPFITCINFVLPIPSLGVRYMVLTYPFIAYLLCIGFRRDAFVKFLLAILPIVFLKEIAVMVIRYQAALEPEFFYYNPLYLIYKYLFT